MPDVVLAIDAGGTKLLGGLVSPAGEVLHRRQVPTPRQDGRCDPGLAATLELADGLLADAADTGHDVRGIGLGFPEYVVDDEVTSTEVFAWTEQPGVALGRLHPGAPVVVEADVRCAAVAESVARGASVESLFYVSWGTGLSTTYVLRGRTQPGHRGEALAFGEWPVPLRAGSEGSRRWDGNLETYASGLGMQRRYEAATGSPATAPVAVLAADGDSVADEVLDGATEALAVALAQVALVIDPQVIVLGGGIGGADGEAVRRVRRTFPTLLHRPGPPVVEAAITGSDAGLVGAGLAAWTRIGG